MAGKRTSRAVWASLFVVVAIVVAASLWTRGRDVRTDDPAPSGRSGAPAAPSAAPARTPRAASGRNSAVSVVEAVVGANRPLSDVVVTMHRRGAHESIRSTSDASGQAAFADLADGAWLAEASAAGHDSATAPCNVSEGVLASPVELVLKKRGVLRGIVHDAAGAVVPKALVFLHPSTEAGMRPKVVGVEPPSGTQKAGATSDDYGRYVLTDVQVEKGYVMYVRGPSAGVRQFDLPPLAPGEDRTVEVVLQQETTVHGEIPAELIGGGRGLVNLLTRNGKGVDQDGRTDVDPEHREFLFRNVTCGEKQLTFTIQNGTRFYTGFLDLRVEEGEHKEVGAWRPLDSTLKLRLKPTLDSQIPRGANLMFDATEGPPRYFMNLMHVRVPIGVDFTVQGMPAGELRLTATVMDAGGLMPRARDGCGTDTLQFDGKFAERELVLVRAGGAGPNGVMTFHVAPPPGVKADDATLHWVLWSGRDAVDCLPRDVKGLVGFNSGIRPAGRYRVEVYGEGCVASKEYDQGDHDGELTIPASAWTSAQTLSGVVRRGGDPVAGATIVLSVKNENGGQSDVAETHSASDGAFEFRSLPQTTELSVFATTGGRSSPRTSVSGFQSQSGVVLELK
jgi:hypothetical protein